MTNLANCIASRSRLLSFSIAALGAAALPGTAYAQAISDSAEARALIQSPIVLTKRVDLDFGRFAADNLVAGTVTIDAVTGARSSTVVIEAGGTPAAALFEAIGIANFNYTITLGSPPTLRHTVDNTLTMPVSTLTLDGPANRTFPASRIGNIQVGGTLDVGADQAEGDYEGDFTIDVSFL